MVAAMLAHRLGDLPVTVESAGVRAPVGQPMDALSAAQLQERGIPVPNTSARQLSADLVESADLVLTATRSHRAEVLDLQPRALRRTFTVLEFAALLDHVDASAVADLVGQAAKIRSQGPSDPDLRDPIDRPIEVHAEVARLADAAVATIAKRLDDLLTQ